MNTQALNPVTVETLPVVVHQGVRVVTTDLLAQIYGAAPENIQDNYRKNADRFEQGKHYFKLDGESLSEFKAKNIPENFRSVGRRTREIMLWTERGAARHAKMLNTDQAWEVFERMEDAYFRAKDFAERHPEPAKTLATDRYIELLEAENTILKQQLANRRRLPLPPTADDLTQAHACLAHILGLPIRLSGGATLTVREALFHADGTPALAALGMRYADGKLLISNSHNRLNRAMTKSRWPNGWGKLLARLPGAEKPPAPIWLGGQVTRVVAVIVEPKG